VLERRAGLPALERDVFINVVGGLRLLDPAADLAVAAALASAELDRPVGNRAFIGEIGLGGEVRAVPNLDRRLSEAARLGISEVFTPAPGSGPGTDDSRSAAGGAPAVVRIRHVRELVERLR
jgi:DNA repair protein RadA/Sms